MENFGAPESPLVTYPMDAAAPGDNWHESRPSPSGEDNAVYVPIPGDENYVDGDFTVCRGPQVPPVQSLSTIMRAQFISFATPSVPSLYTSTNHAAYSSILHFRCSSSISIEQLTFVSFCCRSQSSYWSANSNK